MVFLLGEWGSRRAMATLQIKHVHLCLRYSFCSFHAREAYDARVRLVCACLLYSTAGWPSIATWHDVEENNGLPHSRKLTAADGLKRFAGKSDRKKETRMKPMKRIKAD